LLVVTSKVNENEGHKYYLNEIYSKGSYTGLGGPSELT